MLHVQYFPPPFCHWEDVYYLLLTEEISISVRFYTSIRVLSGSNLGWITDKSDSGLKWFLSVPSDKFWCVSRLGYDLSLLILSSLSLKPHVRKHTHLYVDVTCALCFHSEISLHGFSATSSLQCERKALISARRSQKHREGTDDEY